jgi:hypothetical protein
MQVNFFSGQHKMTSSLERFGLCDDQLSSTSPACINEIHPAKWIGIVNNHGRRNIDFYPIDHCVPLYRSKVAKQKNKVIQKITQTVFNLLRLKEPDKKCDGMLFCNKELIFVELKERGTSGWLNDGRIQLTITINHFRKNHDISNYNKIEAYVCNKLRPFANVGNANQIQRFRNETGLILNVQQEIDIL